LKNRGYAASCRIKRLEQKDDLEGEKSKEFDDLDKLQVRAERSWSGRQQTIIFRK
jgi:transcription factor MAFF/G/K